MIRHKFLTHRFVHHLPERLEPAVLYISMDFATSAHSCCCGCGQEIVAPFTPTDWRMTFDGETVSLWPSIGNWNLPCRSHYVINRGKVIDSGNWSDFQVERERRRDKQAKSDFHEEESSLEIEIPNLPPEETKTQDDGRWKNVRKWLSKILGS